VSTKSGRIAELIAGCQDGNLDPHYVCYFKCFNRGLFYEAHEVLERLWLAERKGPNHSFYKGLIQLAGAFVHLQKNRLRPSSALFKLAHANLDKYPAKHQRLDVGAVRRLIESWLRELEGSHFAHNPLVSGREPRIDLLPER